MSRLTRRDALKLCASAVAAGPNLALGTGVQKPLDITSLLIDAEGPSMRCRPDAAGVMPHGACVAYREDGSLRLEITYRHGVAHGPYRDYFYAGR